MNNSNYSVTSGEDPDAFKAVALGYAQRGLRVFPVHTVLQTRAGDLECSCVARRRKTAKMYGEEPSPCTDKPGKHPLIDKWQDRATTDDKLIRRWAVQSSRANIGIATGKDSGFFVLDIDGDEGEKNLAALESENDPLPATVIVRTGSGGRHLWFRYPDDAAIKNSSNQIASKIDMRGDGGFIVAPPSLHISGGQYRFVDGHGLDDIEIADAPAWLIKLAAMTAADRKAASKTKPASKVSTKPAKSGATGDGWETRLASIGDHEGGTGFDAPIYGVACSYFATEGENADGEPLKAALVEAIAAAYEDPARPRKDSRYLTDDYLDTRISQARGFVGGQRERETVTRKEAEADLLGQIESIDPATVTEDDLIALFSTAHAAKIDSVAMGRLVKGVKKRVGDMVSIADLRALAKKAAFEAVDEDETPKGFPGGTTLRDGRILFLGEPVGPQFEPIGIVRDGAQGEWGLLIKFATHDATKREIVLPFEALMGEEPRALAALLGGAGYVADDLRNFGLLTRGIVNSATPEGRVLRVDAPGFHGDTFITPDGEPIALGEVAPVYFPSARVEQKNGTAEDQKALFRRAFELAGNNAPRLAVAALASGMGAVVNFLDDQSLILSLQGKSSKTKSTSTDLAGSAWGNPAMGAGPVISFNATSNGLENPAVAATGSLIVLDDAKNAPAKTIQATIFMLAGGAGKSRMKTTGEARRILRWQSGVITSSEKSMAEIIGDSGETVLNGLAVRVVEHHVDRERDLRLSDLDALKAGIKHDYGHLGPMLVRELLETGRDRVRERVGHHTELLLGRVERRGGMVDRAVRTFATMLAVGDSFSALNILPSGLDLPDLIGTAWCQFVNAEDGGLRSDAVVDRVCEALLAGRLTSFVDLDKIDDDHRPFIRDVEGWWQFDEVEHRFTFYIPRPSLAKLAGGRDSHQDVAKALRAEGFLTGKGKSGPHLYHDKIPGIGAVKHYRVVLAAPDAPGKLISARFEDAAKAMRTA